MKRKSDNPQISEFSSKKWSRYVALFLTLMVIVGYIGKAQTGYKSMCTKGITYENQDNFEEAIQLYSKAIALKPLSAEAYGYRANAYMTTLNYENAIADATKAISIKPTSVVFHHLRANCFFETKNYKNAISDYSFAISNGKENKYTGIYPITENNKKGDLYFRRGKSLYFDHEYESAIADLSHAIKIATSIKKQVDYMYNWRAKCYLEQANYSEAAKDFEVAIVGFPKDEKMQYSLGISHFKSGNKEKAIEVAQKIIELNSSNENYFSGINLLSIFDLPQRRLTASQYYSKAKAIIDDLKNVTTSYFMNLKASQALPYLDSAWFVAPKLTEEDLWLKDSIIEGYFAIYPKLKTKPEMPENARRYAVQAVNATVEQNYNKSIELWGKALSITPYNPIAFYNLALIWEFKNNYNNAVTYMKKYLQLSPDAEDARNAQDKIYLWESKTTKQNQNRIYCLYPDVTSQLRSKIKQSAGLYYVAFVFGGGAGMNFGDNEPLGRYWDGLDGHSASLETKYGGNLRFAYSGDAEVLIRPVPRFVIGGFGRFMGGVGKNTTIGTEHHSLNLASFQYGGLGRFFMTLNDMVNSLDFYLQFKYGINEINGFYAKSQNSYINYYSIIGSAPVMSFGLGFGGRIGKVSYLTMDFEYYSSTVDLLDTKVVVDQLNPANVGTIGKLNTPINFSGVIVRLMLLGFCF